MLFSRPDLADPLFRWRPISTKHVALAIGVLLLGCQSQPVQVSDEGATSDREWRDATVTISPGQETTVEAKLALERACVARSRAACDVLGRPVQFTATSKLDIVETSADGSSFTLITLYPETSEKPEVSLWDPSTFQRFSSTEKGVIRVPGSKYALLHTTFADLPHSGRYRAQWTINNRLIDARWATAPDLSRLRARFVVASCMDDGDPGQVERWKEVATHRPDWLFLIGDTVYVDKKGEVSTGPATPPQLWSRFLEVRHRLELFHLEELLPVHAVWDDHDFGANDGGADYPHKGVARTVFRSFFGDREIPGLLDRGPGVSSRLDAYGMRFVFLDDRFFRSPKQSGIQGTHFGVDQESWLFTLMSGETPVALFSGDQFFGGYHPFESYEGSHPESFKRFLGRLASQGAPVVFFSGDRHLTEIMRVDTEKLGYPTYEITTSSIHAKTYPGAFKTHPSPKQIVGVDGTQNYIVVESDLRSGFELLVTAFGPERKVLYEKKLSISKDAVTQK